MRIAGALLALAGVLAALARPLFGLPAGFPVLLGAALVLWLVGIGTGAASIAPLRRRVGLAALGAALMSWPTIMLFRLAPLWGGVAAICGLVVAATPRTGDA